MTAARVGPHPRPGALAQRPPGDQGLAAVVDHVQREGQVQRRVPAVHLAAGELPDRLVLGVQQDDAVELQVDIGRESRHAQDSNQVFAWGTTPGEPRWWATLD